MGDSNDNSNDEEIPTLNEDQKNEKRFIEKKKSISVKSCLP